MDFQFLNQNLYLHPLKGLFWREKSLLIIADIHLGKISYFRKSGVGIPSSAISKNLENLRSMINEMKPETVLFLGDLFHSHHNAEWDSFVKIIQEFEGIKFQLIIGNHDILLPEHYKMAELEVFYDFLELHPFVFTHEPDEVKSKNYQIAGHIHPGIKLRGNGLGSLVLPCFYFGEKQAILPAFGYFTGLYKIKPRKSDTIFGVVENNVLKLN